MLRWRGLAAGGLAMAGLLAVSGCLALPWRPGSPLPSADLSAQLQLRPRPPAVADQGLADRVHARVGALGVPESAVEVRDGLLVVRLPPGDLSKVEDHFRQPPARFTMRPVLASANRTTSPGAGTVPGGSPMSPPYELGQIDCRRPPVTGVSSDATVALCAPDAVLVAGPSLMGGEHITAVKADFGPNGGVITVTLDEDGARIFASATAERASRPPPENALALAVDADVIRAPTVIEPIPDGVLEINGAFDRPQSEQIARDIELGATLPVDLA